MLYHFDRGRQCYTCYLTTDSGPLFPIDEREEKNTTKNNKHTHEWNGTEQNEMKFSSRNY